MIRRTAVAVVAALALVAGWASPAAAYEPVEIVHTELAQVGPYQVTVGFSEWPLRAMQSLDFTFVPEGGIAGKSGTVEEIGAGPRPVGRGEPLARHPRKRDVWGIDVHSLDYAGTYRFAFRIDGPQGPGEGSTAPLTVLAQPGPPLGLSWAISGLPFAALLAFLVVAWRRTRPGRKLLPLPA
ncbi:hypothetical protein [Actinoplanes sp. RD1]|uniref:hypothetical protein n=1 Tax=Actinoplanes sp. RD1 TaxID=3064538 RepID=UPI00274161FD|nr:hypothetical protein [Actinoplanes sp. RD1]